MPFYRFQIDAPVPAATVIDRLRAAVGPLPPLLNRRPSGAFADQPFGAEPGEKPDPPFLGSVADDSFRIQRNTTRRNSFIPVMYGRVNSTPRGTQVRVTISMHPLVLLFMVCWLAAVGYGALADPSSDRPLRWGLFVFGLVLPLAGFFPEIGRAKSLLATVILNPDSTAWQLSVN